MSLLYACKKVQTQYVLSIAIKIVGESEWRLQVNYKKFVFMFHFY